MDKGLKEIYLQLSQCVAQNLLTAALTHIFENAADNFKAYQRMKLLFM